MESYSSSTSSSSTSERREISSEEKMKKVTILQRLHFSYKLILLILFLALVIICGCGAIFYCKNKNTVGKENANIVGHKLLNQEGIFEKGDDEKKQKKKKKKKKGSKAHENLHLIDPDEEESEDLSYDEAQEKLFKEPSVKNAKNWLKRLVQPPFQTQKQVRDVFLILSLLTIMLYFCMKTLCKKPPEPVKLTFKEKMMNCLRNNSLKCCQRYGSVKIFMILLVLGGVGAFYYFYWRIPGVKFVSLSSALKEDLKMVTHQNQVIIENYKCTR